MYRTAVVLVVAIAIAPTSAWPQGNPVGPEFRVNTYTTGQQRGPAIAADSSGFVVVWKSDHGGGGVFGQRFAISGVGLGPEFQVSDFTTPPGGAYGSLPSVALDASGNFTVVWESPGIDGSGLGVVGRRYTNSGVPLGPGFRVNTHTTANQYNPAIASDGVGNFVVAWQNGPGLGVFGQRYDSSGNPLGSEFRVNTSITDGQFQPAIARDAGGTFVVVWKAGYPAVRDVAGRLFAASGAPLGPEFRVNTYTSSIKDDPSVAVDAAGNFVVVWASLGQAGSFTSVYGQRHANTGIPLGPEFRINTPTSGHQFDPSVAMDASGNYVVAWVSAPGSTPGFLPDLLGQRYSTAGVPLGSNFRVNTFGLDLQNEVAVAADPAGNHIAVWTTDWADGWGKGVFGQRYNMILPVELTHFGVE